MIAGKVVGEVTQKGIKVFHSQAEFSCPSCDDPVNTILEYKPGITFKQISRWKDSELFDKAEKVTLICDSCGYKEER